MRIITAKETAEIKQRYEELKNHIAVARVMHLSPSTIKEIIGIQSATNDSIIRFERALPEFNARDFNLDESCTLTEEEIEKLPQLWDEMEL